MEIYEIYQVEFRWGNCDDARPWLIVQIRPGDIFGCLPIASECYGGSCFPISRSHPDFPATGLTKDCHIHDSKLYDIPKANFLKRRGKLAGSLLAEFQDFSGL